MEILCTFDFLFKIEFNVIFSLFFKLFLMDIKIAYFLKRVPMRKSKKWILMLLAFINSLLAISFSVSEIVFAGLKDPIDRSLNVLKTQEILSPWRKTPTLGSSGI
jgi:uncharacterized membrane protein